MMGDADKGEGCSCVGTSSIWELSILFAQFCSKPKTPLKNSLLIHKKCDQLQIIETK